MTSFTNKCFDQRRFFPGNPVPGTNCHIVPFRIHPVDHLRSTDRITTETRIAYQAKQPLITSKFFTSPTYLGTYYFITRPPTRRRRLFVARVPTETTGSTAIVARSSGVQQRASGQCIYKLIYNIFLYVNFLLK